MGFDRDEITPVMVTSVLPEENFQAIFGLAI